MYCGFASRYGFQVLKRPQPDTAKIFGTWDFKWPKDRVIRVAFQRLSAKDEKSAGLTFKELTGKVIKYVSTWGDGYQKAFGRPSPLSFEFLPEWLPSPDTRAFAGRSKGEDGRPVEYDVLVSLSPMPFAVSYDVKVTVPPSDRLKVGGKAQLWRPQTVNQDTDGQPLQVALPTSELGRYAVRCDYGVPTVYVGRANRDPLVQQRAKMALGMGLTKALTPTTDTDLASYFGPADGLSASLEFEATVVHEFGHVLGIPHLHQSPLDRLRWRTIDDLRNLIAAETGVQVDEDAIRAQVMLPFPCSQSLGGDVLYSDWSPLPRDQYGDPQLVKAAMAHPLLQFMVLPATKGASVPAVFKLLEPTPLDLGFLDRMYPA